MRRRDQDDTRRCWISVTDKTREIMYVSGMRSKTIRKGIFKQFAEEKVIALRAFAYELTATKPKK